MGRKIRMSDLDSENDRWFDAAERGFVESRRRRTAKARRRGREFDPQVAREHRRPAR